MYNRYVPQDGFQPVEPTGPDPGQKNHSAEGEAHSPLRALLEQFSGGKNTDGLTGILRSLRLDNLDRGDILLLLLILYLFWESDDTELLITLALLFLMGL